MKTYLSIIVDSEGAKPSEIKNQLSNLGFKSAKGNYDFVYEWDKEVDTKNLIWFADKIHTALQGMKVKFSMQTI